MSRIAPALYVIVGSIFLGLGVIGIFLPLLPTTPLLLLAAACYTRGSPRLNRWLLSHPTLGRYLSDYREGRGMTLGAKVASLGLLWLGIGASAYLVNLLWVRLLLLAVLVGVTTHLLRLKTAPRDQDNQEEQ